MNTCVEVYHVTWISDLVFSPFTLKYPFSFLFCAGSKKSLQHVFQDGACHPKMAMVIDDRLQVWDDKDQPRVHVVPAYTPYYAPQAEVFIILMLFLIVSITNAV